MTDATTSAPSDQLPIPTRRDVAKGNRSRPLRVTGRLKRVCDLMVYGPADGPNAGKAMAWNEAAKLVGYRVASMRNAIDKVHVREYLRTQKEVFRASASAQNIARAIAIRDQDDNKTAAVQAMRYLDNIADEQVANSGGGASKPGVVIVINGERPANLIPDLGVIEINPLESQGAGGQGE